MLANYKKQLAEAITSSIKCYLEISDRHKKKKRNFSRHLKLQTHKQPLTNCGFSKYGEYFATCSYDRTCKIWDTSSGNLINTLSGHRKPVFCLNFSHFSDQIILATGSFDHTARLWGLNGKMLQNFSGHTAEVTGVKFNPNGSYLCSSSLDSTARVWDI